MSNADGVQLPGFIIFFSVSPLFRIAFLYLKIICKYGIKL